MHGSQFIWEGQRRARLDEAARGLRDAVRQRRPREAARQLWRLWSALWFPLGWIDRQV